MSLKTFHIFFVTVSILFCVGFSLWCFREYARVDGVANLLLACGTMLFAVALLCYGKWFLKKLKGVE